MAAQPAPTLQQRIEFAEACIELTWARIPKARTGLIERSRWRHANAKALDDIDTMLEALALMYLERAGLNGCPDHPAAV
jgi:hypothetical protein